MCTLYYGFDDMYNESPIIMVQNKINILYRKQLKYLGKVHVCIASILIM